MKSRESVGFADNPSPPSFDSPISATFTQSFIILITPFGTVFWSDEADIPILHTHKLKAANPIYQINSPFGLEGVHLHGQRSRLRRKD